VRILNHFLSRIKLIRRFEHIWARMFFFSYQSPKPILYVCLRKFAQNFSRLYFELITMSLTFLIQNPYFDRNYFENLWNSYFWQVWLKQFCGFGISSQVVIFHFCQFFLILFFWLSVNDPIWKLFLSKTFCILE
jgi:hypothetical protein